MRNSTSSVILPPIQSIFDDVARYEATNRYSHLHHFPNFIHVPTNRTLLPPVSNVYSHPTSLQSSCQTLPRIPSYSQATFPPAHLQDPYLRVPHNCLCRPGSGESMKPWRDRSPNAFHPLRASSSNAPETDDLSPGSYIAPPVALPDQARGPQLGHPPPPITKGVAPYVLKDGSRAHAMDFQSEQAVWAPSVSPRPIVEPAIEHESLVAFRLANGFAFSSSLPLSPSIEGSPRMTLPFPLIPAIPAASRSRQSLPEAQIMSSQNAGTNVTSDKALGPTRAHVKLTKNGKPYTRDRVPEFTLPPNQKKVSRTTWCEWEKDAAMKAIDWYEKNNPAFVLSKSTDAERKLALPIIYDHIIGVIMPKSWRRTYDGFLTWTANARKRPTLRRPAGWDGATAREPAQCGTAKKAAANKPKQTTEKGPRIAA